MADMAKSRLGQVKSKFPNAVVTGLDDLRCFYLLADKPMKYYEYAGADGVPQTMDRKMALRRIGRSLKDLTKEWNILHRLVS
jgi:hypothetical protein